MLGLVAGVAKNIKGLNIGEYCGWFVIRPGRENGGGKGFGGAAPQCSSADVTGSWKTTGDTT